MQPVEELFDLENDSMELKQLASDPEHATALNQMREQYDQELDKWKQHAVDYNDYQRFGTLFDRNVPISQKNIEKKKAKKSKKRKKAKPTT